MFRKIFLYVDLSIRVFQGNGLWEMHTSLYVRGLLASPKSREEQVVQFESTGSLETQLSLPWRVGLFFS